MSEKSKMIAYCGLYCQECPSYTGSIADLARDLRKELRTFRYDKIENRFLPTLSLSISNTILNATRYLAD